MVRARARTRATRRSIGVRVDFNQPYFFTPHFSFGGEAQQWWTYTPAYRSAVKGVKATLTHRQSAQMSWAVFIQSEFDSSTVEQRALDDPSLYSTLISLGLNPITGEQRGTLNATGFDLQRSTADNL